MPVYLVIMMLVMASALLTSLYIYFVKRTKDRLQLNGTAFLQRIEVIDQLILLGLLVTLGTLVVIMLIFG